MVLQSNGQISWSNFAVEYNIVGEVGYGNLRMLDKRLPQSTPVSSSNLYGLYQYPVASNVLFLEASNATSYPGSGTGWRDLSGLSNNFTLPVSGITWNSAGYFTAGASHNGINGPTNNVFSISTEHTVEFVARARTNNSNNSFIWFESTTGQNRMINVHLPWSDNTIYYDVRGVVNATNRISVATTTNTNPNGGIRHYVFRCRSTPTPNRNIFCNGTSIADSGANSTSIDFTWGGPSYLLTNPFGGNAWAGDLYYVRIYNRALTNTEITNLYNTMKSKYGI
jgi:hypothetical protein